MLELTKNSKSQGKFYFKMGGRIILTGATHSAQSHRHMTFLGELCGMFPPHLHPTQKVRFGIKSR